jgi:prepilin-type N-terminal cleavage/methylation domain-containing protein
MKNNGFTLLEVLIVVGIMGVIAAMVWPLRAVLDDSQREKVTHEQVRVIRQAILGHDQVVDRLDRDRIVSGYVGDMGDWPELWEPGGTGGSGGLGKDDRGVFIKDRFQWERPYQEVTASARAAQSLGQPRGLWTRHLRDAATADIKDRPGENKTWLGPYLSPPVASRRALGSQYATSQDAYEALDEADRAYFHLLQGDGQLVDGWNRAFRFFLSKDPADSGSDDDEVFWIVSLGQDGRGDFPEDMFEYYDDGVTDPYYKRAVNQDNIVTRLYKSEWRELLRLMGRRSGSTSRLVFMTQDSIEKQIVRALIGDAPAGPNTGFTGDNLKWPDLWNWVCRFGRDLTPSAPYPCSGICRDASDVEGVCQDNACLNSEVNGTALNTSEEVITCAKYPEGEWEDSTDSGDPYTYGQPRGLWDKGVEPDSQFGVGWRHNYLPNPSTSGALEANATDPGEYLEDYFNQPFHFFKIGTSPNMDLLILSGGDDETVVFETNTSGVTFEYPVPVTDVINDPDLTVLEEINAMVSETQNLLDLRTRQFDFVDYDSSDENEDNIHRLVRRKEWVPGYLNIETLRVDNVSGSLLGDLKCKLFGVLDASGVAVDPIYEAGVNGTHNATATPPYWEVGNATAPAFDYKGSGNILVSGARYLVCWKDTNANHGDVPGEPDPDEEGWWKIYSVPAHPAKIEQYNVFIDANGFVTLP